MKVNNEYDNDDNEEELEILFLWLPMTAYCNATFIFSHLTYKPIVVNLGNVPDSFLYKNTILSFSKAQGNFFLSRSVLCAARRSVSVRSNS